MYCYRMGDIGFGFDTDLQLEETHLYDLFRIDESEFYRLTERNYFSIKTESEKISDFGMPVFSCSSYSVYRVDDGYVKITNRYNRREYKCICRQNNKGGEISFTDNGIDSLLNTVELFRLIDLVTALLSFDALILHGAVIRHGEKCIVFSGDSGAGKSTQAELWNKYKGSEILNGDRLIIRRIDGVWYAFGIPMRGSSDYCCLFRLPVECIVFPEKAEYNRIGQFDRKMERFIRLNSQINCGSRKKEETDKLLSLTEDIINNIEIVRLFCTPDDGAVKCLSDYLARK